MQIILMCAGIVLWIAFVVSVTALILRRTPNRFVFAGAIGLVTAVTLLIAVLGGVAPFQQPNWLAPLLGGSIFFCITLLWTYLGPLLRGTTWAEMIKTERARGLKVKESVMHKDK